MKGETMAEIQIVQRACDRCDRILAVGKDEKVPRHRRKITIRVEDEIDEPVEESETSDCETRKAWSKTLEIEIGPDLCTRCKSVSARLINEAVLKADPLEVIESGITRGPRKPPKEQTETPRKGSRRKSSKKSDS